MHGEMEGSEKNLHQSCIVCGKDKWVVFREGCDFHRPEDRKVFRLTRCLSCGHIMQNPLPDAEELSKAYSVEYAPYRPAWKETGWPLWKILRVLTTLRRMHRLRRYAKGVKLLEVGSGAGDFLYASHRAGWEVAAVEYSKPLVDLLRSELSFDAHSGELRLGMWQQESFDVVALWSVLEHVPNPLETLSIASSYLRRGGTVFIQLPTSHGVESGGRFGQYWAILELPRHLNFFNRKSLSDLCAKAGMDLTVFKTPLLDIAWCELTSCLSFASSSKNQAQKLWRLALFIPLIILGIPYMAIQAWRGHGTEAFALAVKR